MRTLSLSLPSAHSCTRETVSLPLRTILPQLEPLVPAVGTEVLSQAAVSVIGSHLVGGARRPQPTCNPTPSLLPPPLCSLPSRRKKGYQEELTPGKKERGESESGRADCVPPPGKKSKGSANGVSRPNEFRTSFLQLAGLASFDSDDGISAPTSRNKTSTLGRSPPPSPSPPPLPRARAG